MAILLLLVLKLHAVMVIRDPAGYAGWQASRYAGPAGFVSNMPGLRRNGAPGLCNADGCRANDSDEHYSPAGDCTRSGAPYSDER